MLLLVIDGGDARFLFSRLFVNTQCIEQIQYPLQITFTYVIRCDAIQTTHSKCMQCVQTIVNVVKLCARNEKKEIERYVRMFFSYFLQAIETSLSKVLERYANRLRLESE